MPDKPIFRWQRGGSDRFFACSGEHWIGHVAQRSTDGLWVWKIDDVVGSKHQRATHGTSKTEEGAKQAFRRAWLHWLAERGLREIG